MGVGRGANNPHRKKSVCYRTFSRGSGGVEWIQLAQDRNQWQALVNMMMMILQVLVPWS